MVAEVVGVGINLELGIDVILNTDLFLTGSQTKQVSDEVDYSIGAGILLSPLLLSGGSRGDKLE